MGKMYQKVDALIMPSLRETTGSVLVESLENGIPIITADCFGAHVILNEKVSYLYDFSSEDPVVSLSSKICEFMDMNISDTLSEECFAVAKNNSFENKVKKYQCIYERLINEDSRKKTL